MQEAETRGGGLSSSPWPLWTPLLEAPSQPQFLGETALVAPSLKWWWSWNSWAWWASHLTGKMCTGFTETGDPPSPAGVLQVDQVTREEGHWALQGQLPAPSGWAAIPNVGAQMHLPKGKGKGKEGEGKMVTPRKPERISLGNMKAVENPFSLGTINEEGRKIPQGAIPCKHNNFQAQGLEKSHLGHTM